MKVLIVITQGVWGGAQRHVFDLAVGLKDSHAVTVMHGAGDALPSRLAAEGVRTVPLTNLKRSVGISDIYTFIDLLRFILRERPDIVHAHSSKIAVLASIAGVLTGTKTVVTFHGFAFTQTYHPLLKPLLFLTYGISALLASHIIAVSRHIYKNTPFGFLVERKMSLIYNGIACTPNSPLSIPEVHTPFVIGTIGELHETKGFDTLIEAYRLLPEHIQSETTVVIAGEGQERERLERLVKTHNLSSRVRLLGFIPDAHRLMPAFTCFVLPSRSEALGYVLLEAGCAGVCALGTNVGGIPEVIDLTVPKENPEALAEALARVLTDPSIRHSMAERLSDRVRTGFTREAMLQKTRGVYERLIRRPKTRA